MLWQASEFPLTIFYFFLVGNKLITSHHDPGTKKTEQHLLNLMVLSSLGANCFPPTAALISQFFFLKSTKSINIPKGSFSSCWCDYKAQCALIGFINWVIVGIECQYFTHKCCSIKLLFNARDLSFAFLTAKAHKALLQSVNPVLEKQPQENSSLEKKKNTSSLQAVGFI